MWQRGVEFKNLAYADTDIIFSESYTYPLYLQNDEKFALFAFGSVETTTREKEIDKS